MSSDKKLRKIKVESSLLLMSFFLFSSILSDEIFLPVGPICGSGVVVSQNLIPVGLQGTL